MKQLTFFFFGLSIALDIAPSVRCHRIKLKSLQVQVSVHDMNGKTCI